MSNTLDYLLKLLTAEAAVMDQINAGQSLRYNSNQRLILEYGKPFLKRVNPTPFKGEPKQCFQNCFEALWNHRELSYCEGYAIYKNSPIAVSHAWLVNDKLEVIDPTWIDEDSENCVYFGVVFTREFLIEFVTKTRVYGILDSDYLNDYKLLNEGFPTGALHS